MNSVEPSVDRPFHLHPIRPPSYQIYQDITVLRQASNAPIAKLCSNESPLGINPLVLKALSKQSDEISCYSDPDSMALKIKLAENHQVETENLLIGNGSTEVLELITRAHIKRGNTAIVSKYSYPLYALLIKNCGAWIKTVPTKIWEYDLEEIYNAIENTTRIIFLSNPNNPTGAWINIEQLERFIRAIPKHVLIVVDEAYYDFMKDEFGYATVISLTKHYENLVVTRTFSKAYGLAGLRIGYAIAHPQVIQKSLRFKQSSNVNIMAQIAASIACTDDTYRESVLNTVNKNRQMFIEQLNQFNMRFLPAKTNFLLIRTKERTQIVYKKLIKHRVIIQPLELYNLPFHIRVSIGKESEIRQFFLALEKEKLLC